MRSFCQWVRDGYRGEFSHHSLMLAGLEWCYASGMETFLSQADVRKAFARLTPAEQGHVQDAVTALADRGVPATNALLVIAAVGRILNQVGDGNDGRE